MKKFNPTVTVSDLLKIFGGIAAVLVGLYGFREFVVEKLARIEERVIATDKSLDKLETQVSNLQMYLMKRAEENRLFKNNVN